MKTFKELQEGDKIFIWADKPSYITYFGNNKFDNYSHSGEIISGAYNIKSIRNSGFCKRFLLNTIIGNNFDLGYINSNEFVINRDYPIPYIERKIWWYDNNNTVNYPINKCTQVLFITTSEEKWLEKMNEDI